MFTSILSLPQNPFEARLVADALESLARALREWPADAWRQVADRPAAERVGEGGGLFGRLVADAAPLALDPAQRQRAIASAEEVAAVLRCLWPEARRAEREGQRQSDRDRDRAPVLAAAA